MYSADLDGDGDMDVLGAAWVDGITWWGRTRPATDLPGPNMLSRASFNGAYGVYAADVDGDGDPDVLGASRYVDGITWWENTASNGSVWTEHVVDDAFDSATSVYSADLDGDGDLDVIGASYFAGITWWENTAGDDPHPIRMDRTCYRGLLLLRIRHERRV